MENLNAPDGGTASTLSPALIEETQVDDLHQIKAALKGRFDIVKILATSEEHLLLLAREELNQGNEAASDNLVRLKVLSRLAARDSRKIELFYLESFAASRLSHPNITKTSEPEYIGGIHFCAIEHNSGFNSLRSLLNQNAWLAAELASFIAGQIVEALEHAHAMGVLHLNLQPENILIANDRRVLVTGFGIGSYEEFAWARHKRSRRLPAQYLSPEQAQGFHIDHRSDLYSLGVLLFEMLTDRVPFDSNDSELIKRKHVSHAPQSPQVYRSGVSALQSELVMSLLEKNPDKRCHSTAQLRSVLGSLARPSSNVSSNFAVADPTRAPIESSASIGNDLQANDDTGDDKEPTEVETPSPEMMSASIEEMPNPQRDPFYEDEYTLPIHLDEDEPEVLGEYTSSGSTELFLDDPLENVSGDKAPARSDDLDASADKPDRFVSREVFEPPTITVIDPPLYAPENTPAADSFGQVIYHKGDRRDPLAVEESSKPKSRWGILALLAVVVAVLIAILLAQGNHLSRLFSKPAAATAAKVASETAINPEAGSSAPAQTEVGKTDSSTNNGEGVAQENDGKRASARQSQANKPLWRAHPVARSQGFRAKRSISRAQAQRLRLRSRQRSWSRSLKTPTRSVRR